MDHGWSCNSKSWVRASTCPDMATWLLLPRARRLPLLLRPKATRYTGTPSLLLACVVWTSTTQVTGGHAIARHSRQTPNEDRIACDLSMTSVVPTRKSRDPTPSNIDRAELPPISPWVSAGRGNQLPADFVVSFGGGLSPVRSLVCFGDFPRLAQRRPAGRGGRLEHLSFRVSHSGVVLSFVVRCRLVMLRLGVYVNVRDCFGVCQ